MPTSVFSSEKAQARKRSGSPPYQKTKILPKKQSFFTLLLTFFFCQPDHPLGYPAGHCHNNDRYNNGDHQYRGQNRFQIRPCRQKTDACRDKHRRHNIQQKISRHLHLFQFDKLCTQCKKHQKKAINTGRDRKRQNRMTDLTQKCYSHDHSKFIKQFHLMSFLPVVISFAVSSCKGRLFTACIQMRNISDSCCTETCFSLFSFFCDQFCHRSRCHHQRMP